MEKAKLKSVLVPPDGGWGWVVCMAYALSNIMVIPILQSFGLIFKETFADIGLNMKDSAIIINTNSAFGMLMGLVNGSILKKFGYRKGAVVGGLFLSIGVILTAFADNFYFYLFSYGIITSLGFGLTMSAFSLALNSYFSKKRSRATGYGMTLTGLGPIIMPFCISYLLDEYGSSNCILIIGAMSLNTLVAASLLQPLKWHMKEIIPDQELMPLEIKNGDEFTENLIHKETHSKNVSSQDNINDMVDSSLSIDHDIETQSIYGFDTPLPRRKTSLNSAVYDPGKHRKRTFSRSTSQPERHIAISVNSLNSLRSIAEDEKVKEDEATKHKNTIAISTIDGPNILSQPKKKQTCFNKMFKFFDLDLLKDPVYLNLMLGMSLAICAEINFSLLTPFILDDYGLTTYQIAQVMSTIAAFDIVFRFCAPFIADWFHITPRVMYMISLIMLITSRTALVFVHGSFYAIVIVAGALGISKGFRTVFMSLLIPCYVPLEKLASASGLQMVVNGIVNLLSGPILGAIRDSTGSYDKCIIVINVITFSTLLMWTIEFIYIKLKKNR